MCSNMCCRFLPTTRSIKFVVVFFHLFPGTDISEAVQPIVVEFCVTVVW